MNDLERAYNALRAKTPLYDRLFRYYDGDQPLMYANQRLREVFAGVETVFTENWCSVVIDAARDRINLSGFAVADEQIQNVIDDLVFENDLLLGSDDVHEAALITGEAFVIVWPDEITGQPQAYYNDPRLCHVFYQSDNPRVVSYAAKQWVTDDDRICMTLYYPDRLEYYVTRNKSASVNSAAAFIPLEPPTAVNPYGIVPVFHFQLQRRSINGDLKSVIPLQNGINKLLTDMMVSAEYGAFKQRWIISNADVSALRNAPNEVWSIPSGDGMGQGTQIGEFSATDLGNYLAAIDSLAVAIAAITRTPKNYFSKTGGDPSGEALIAMEAPLIKKCQDRIDRFVPVWRNVVSFMLQIGGYSLDARDITPMFDDPATIQPRTNVEITQIRVGTGVPLTTALRMEGWSQSELDAMAADKNSEAAAQQTNLAMALLTAERQFNAGETEANNAQPN